MSDYVAPVAAPGVAAGTGVLADVTGLYSDVASDHDTLATVFDTGGFALDVLGDIGDPLGAVLGCAVGWIVEHLSFLREPVDWLAGDPRSIEAATTTWANVGTGMRTDAARLATALEQLSADAWSGAAADAYRRKAAHLIDVLDGSAQLAELESVLVAATGGLCAGVRGTIFTAISDALEKWVMVGLVALANSAWTFGASLAAWVVDVEIEAGLLAARISAKIAELVEKAGRIAETLGRDGGRLEHIGEKLIRLSESMLHNVRSHRARLGWDRRYAGLDRSGRARHDGGHLHHSVGGATGLLHLGAAKTVLEQTQNGVQVAVDPSADHLGDAAAGVTDAATTKAGKKIRNIVTGEDRP